MELGEGEREEEEKNEKPGGGALRGGDREEAPHPILGEAKGRRSLTLNPVYIASPL